MCAACIIASAPRWPRTRRLQMVLESDPLPPEGVIGMLRRVITTEHPTLRDLVAHTLESIRTEMARTHVPDKRAYLIVAPAPEPALGLAGVTQGVKEAVGLGRKSGGDPDRYGLDMAVEDVVSLCQAMGLRAHRLRGGEVVSLLWRCANPGVPEPENLSAAEDLAGALAPTAWEEGFRDVRVGDVYTRSLYLLEPPDITSPGWIDDLVSLDATVRLSWHVRGRDREAERTRQLKRRQRLLSVAAARRLGDPETEVAGTEAEVLADQLLAADVSVVWSTLVVTLQAPDRAALDRATSRARRILRARLAAPFGWGRGYQRALWRASLPFGVDVSRRARRWHSYSVGNGLPFLAHNPGTATGMPLGFTTQGHELVLLDLVDPSLPNAVGIFAGRPGMGKTITLNRLGLWSLYAGRRVCFVDPAGHFGPLVELAGGEVIAPGKERAPKTVNLWDLPAGADLAEKIEHLVAAHEIMLTKRGEDLTPLHRALLDTAAQRVYADHGLVEGGDAGDRPPLVGADAPLEGELVAHLWRMADDTGRTLGEQEMLRQMHAALQQYVGTRPLRPPGGASHHGQHPEPRPQLRPGRAARSRLRPADVHRHHGHGGPRQEHVRRHARHLAGGADCRRAVGHDRAGVGRPRHQGHRPAQPAPRPGLPWRDAAGQRPGRQPRGQGAARRGQPQGHLPPARRARRRRPLHRRVPLRRAARAGRDRRAPALPAHGADDALPRVEEWRGAPRRGGRDAAGPGTVADDDRALA